MLMKPILTPDLVRGARGLLGWSQLELASKAGVTTRTIGRLESDVESPSAKVNIRLHEAFANNGIRFVATYTHAGELETYGVLKTALPTENN